MPKSILKILTLAILASISLTACKKPEDSDEKASHTKTSQPVEIVKKTHVMPENKEQIKDETNLEMPITVLALGDSLTEGLGVTENEAYPAQLENSLKKEGYINIKVINSGLSGETSTGLVNRLNWVLKTKPDITILTIGANDAMRGIDVTTVEKNIRTAIERLQNENSIVILSGMQIHDNLGDEYVKAFSDIYPKLAEKYNVAFIPFFLQGVAGDENLNQSDTIHPTKDGYKKIVATNILPILKPVLKNFVESKNDK